MKSKELGITFSKKSALLVRALRNFFGWSQDELAQKAGVSRPTISKLEKLQVGSIRAETLDQILAVFQAEGVQLRFQDGVVELVLSDATFQNASDHLQESIKARGKAGGRAKAEAFVRAEPTVRKAQPESKS